MGNKERSEAKKRAAKLSRRGREEWKERKEAGGRRKGGKEKWKGGGEESDIREQERE